MKTTLLILFLVLFTACTQTSAPAWKMRFTKPQVEQLFDKTLLTKVLGEAKSVDDLEKKLNDETVSLHKVDLNADGKRDLLRVFRHGDGKSYQLMVEVAPNRYEEVGVIEGGSQKQGGGPSFVNTFMRELLYRSVGSSLQDSYNVRQLPELPDAPKWPRDSTQTNSWERKQDIRKEYAPTHTERQFKVRDTSHAIRFGGFGRKSSSGSLGSTGSGGGSGKTSFSSRRSSFGSRRR